MIGGLLGSSVTVLAVGSYCMRSLAQEALQFGPAARVLETNAATENV